MELAQLVLSLEFRKTGLIHLLLGVKHVEQRARTEVQILLLIKLARLFTQSLLAAQNLQGGGEANCLAAGLQ